MEKQGVWNEGFSAEYGNVCVGKLMDVWIGEGCFWVIRVFSLLVERGYKLDNSSVLYTLGLDIMNILWEKKRIETEVKLIELQNYVVCDGQCEVSLLKLLDMDCHCFLSFSGIYF